MGRAAAGETVTDKGRYERSGTAKLGQALIALTSATRGELAILAGLFGSDHWSGLPPLVGDWLLDHIGCDNVGAYWMTLRIACYAVLHHREETEEAAGGDASTAGRPGSAPP